MPTVPTSPTSVKVLLVDDQWSILAGVCALLATSEEPRIHVSGTARDGKEALELARSTNPHVIVLDVHLGDESGIALIQELRSVCSAAVVMLTGLPEPNLRRHALDQGACDLVAKCEPGSVLIRAIRSAAVPQRPQPESST